MDNNFSLDLKAEWLPVIGKLLGGAGGPLSPFSADGEGNEATARAAMQQAGLLAADGQLAAPARPVLAALAGARAVTRVRFVGVAEKVEYMAYFPPDGSQPFALTNDAGTLRVQRPAPTDSLCQGLSAYTGSSPLRGLPVDSRLSTGEAVALLALTDLQRKNSLARLAAGHELVQVACSADAVANEVAAGRRDGQSLLGVLRTLEDKPLLFAADKVRQALAGLTEKRLAIASGGGYVLEDRHSLLANRMLIVENVLLIDSMKAGADGTVIRARSLAAQAGTTDMLYLEADAETVWLKGISARALLTLANELLSDPNALAVLAGNSAAAGGSPAAAASGDKCKKCGLPIPTTAKFCMECGAAR